MSRLFFLLTITACASQPPAVTLGAANSPRESSPAACPEGFASIPAAHAFCLAKTEVTAADYKACVSRGQCNADGLHCDEAATYDDATSADDPINCVDWSQATKYCAAKGYRLPTEEELIWVARNGAKGTAYPWGNEPPNDNGRRP